MRSILEHDAGVTNVVVTISNPRLEGQNLTYEVKTLEGDLPKTGGAAALFIDVIIVRRAPVRRTVGYAKAAGRRALLAVRSTRSCAWIAAVEAGHAANPATEKEGVPCRQCILGPNHEPSPNERALLFEIF